MAINQTEKRRTLARRIVQHASGLMDVFSLLDDDLRQANKAGVVFADTDFADIAGLAHLDAATVTAALTSIVSLRKFLNGNAGTNDVADHMAVFEKVRP